MQFFYKKNISQIRFLLSLNKEIVICLALVLLPTLYPKTANAGLFSFVNDITTDKIASAKNIDSDTSNSQTILVLKAVVNTDPNPSKDLNDNPMVSGNALVPEIGPSGTASDVDQEKNNTQISLYVVRDGDTLSKIAKMFDVTTNTIIWANDLDRNSGLQEGQKLVILPISGIKYKVKKGDTIKSIVSKNKADLNEVLQYNDLTLSSVLNTGDTIIIPDAEPSTETTVTKSIFRKSSPNPVHDADGPFYPGYYIRPVDVGYESQGLHGYNAVDLAAPSGTPIHASASGTVIASMTGGWHGGYGNYVIISHPNGTQTLYAHTLKNFVKAGDRVEQGQMIAKVGTTGHSTGPHVHFEIRGAKNPF